MNIIVAILALGLLIVLHEAGHFLAARWCGMTVYEFSIGFGPRLWFFKMGETEYSLRAIFLGGYVRVAGMHPAEEDVDDEGSFLKSAPWKRFVMIAAGPLANYLTAIVLFFLIFGGWGTRDSHLLIKQVDSKSALGQKLQPNDHILSIDGKPVADRMPKTPLFSFWGLVQKNHKKRLVLTILRAGKKHKVSFPKITTKQLMATKLGLKVAEIGLTTVSTVQPESMAAKIGLQAGDRLLAVDKDSIDNAFYFLRFANARYTKGFQLKVSRKGKVLLLSWKKPAPKAKRLSLGIKVKNLPSLKVTEVKAGSLAQAAGLLAGDQVLKVNHMPLKSIEGRSAYSQARSLLAKCHLQKKPMILKILREGTIKTIALKNPKGSCAKGLKFRPTIQILVMQTLPKSTARKIGLKAGDRMIAVDGKEIGGFYQMLSLFRHRIYRNITLKVIRDGKQVIISAPIAKKVDGWKLGFQPQLDFPRERATLMVALRGALLETWRWNVRIYQGLAKVFSGREKANFTGPVGIVQMAQQTVKRGANYFLIFLAVISIHLAFFNLLPIPALDGGRLMFLFTQQLLRLFGGKEELGVRIEMIANLVGFFLLLGLLLFITFKDVVKIVRGLFGEG